MFKTWTTGKSICLLKKIYTEHQRQRLFYFVFKSQKEVKGFFIVDTTLSLSN